MQENSSRLDSPQMQWYRRVYADSPKWNGETDLKNKTVIVYCEQGYGDIINFSRFIPILKNLGCKVILHCPSKLKRLFYQLKIDGFIDKTSEVLPKHDLHIPLMSIPYLLDISEIPRFKFSVPLFSLPGFENYFKIGIAWEGNPKHERNSIRSCDLANFKPLFGLPNTKIFSLQKEVITASFSENCENLELYSVVLDDFLDTASLIEAMDIVVTVDTSIVHVAGSLDKKTFVLLDFDHDARWLIRKWYPSLVLLRQSTQNNWTPLINEVVKRIGF